MSVYVFGSLRMFNKSVSLSAQKVRPLAGLDEMSSHIAYVIYSYLRLKLRQEGSVRIRYYFRLILSYTS